MQGGQICPSYVFWAFLILHSTSQMIFQIAKYWHSHPLFPHLNIAFSPSVFGSTRHSPGSDLSWRHLQAAYILCDLLGSFVWQQWIFRNPLPTAPLIILILVSSPFYLFPNSFPQSPPYQLSFLLFMFYSLSLEEMLYLHFIFSTTVCVQMLPPLLFFYGVYMLVRVPTFVCVGATGQPQVFLRSCPPLVFKSQFLNCLELSHLARLTGPQAPGICLFPSSQCWDYQCMPSSQFFFFLK